VFFAARDAEHEGGRATVVHFPAAAVGAAELVSTTGAGDCFAAGFVHAASRGQTLDRAVSFGQAAAAHALRCAEPVPASLVRLSAAGEGGEAGEAARA